MVKRLFKIMLLLTVLLGAQRAPYGSWLIGTEAHAMQALVPETGQTTSYADGDDGALRPGVPWPTTRFSNNGNGTITDNLTGLTWLQNANCTETAGGIDKSGGLLSWANALAWSNNLAAPTCNLSDGSVAGDWRLPNAKELESLVDLQNFNPALPTGHPFSTVLNSYYWSSSRHANTVNAWFVDLSYGSVYLNYKFDIYSVWPVRGGQGGALGSLSLSPAAPDFGAKNLLDTVSKTLTLTNGTKTPATISASSISGANAADFSLADACSGKTLAPNATCTITAKYQPRTCGAKNATISIPSTIGTLTVPMVATACGSGNATIDAMPTTGPLPLTVNFTAITPLVAMEYQWDFDGDGIVDTVTTGRSVSNTYQEITPANATVTVKDIYGTLYKSPLVTITPSTPSTISEALTFTPYYPISDTTASEVMKGGTVTRWYHITDMDGKNMSNRGLVYRLNGTGAAQIVFTDDAGFASITTEAISANSTYTIEVLNPDNSVNQLVTNPPTFSINVLDRDINQEWSILFGTKATVGIGLPGFKFGPLKFKTAEAGIGVNRSATMKIAYAREKGRDTVKLSNSLSDGIFIDGFLGAEGRLWSGRTAPSFTAGVSSEAEYSNKRGTQLAFDDFFNSSSANHDAQMLASGVFLFDTALRSLPSLPVGAKEIVDWLVNKLDQAGGVVTFREELQSENNVRIAPGVKFEINAINPFGFAPGSGMKVSLIDLSGETISKLSTKEMKTGSGYGIGLTTSYNLSALSVGFSQKFGGDKRKKDTPNFSLSNFTLFNPVNYEGTKAVDVEMDSNKNITKLSLRQTLSSSTSDSWVLGQTVTTKEAVLNVTKPSTFTSLRYSSDILKSIMNHTDVPIFNSTLNEAWYEAYVAAIEPEEVRTEIKESSAVALDLDFELALGLKLGLGFKLEYIDETQFTEKKGIISNSTNMLRLESYTKDTELTNKKKQLSSLLGVYKSAVQNALKDMVSDAFGSVTDGISQIGANIKGGVTDAIGHLAQLIPTKSVNRMMALRTVEQAATAEPAQTATAIGNVYIVNITDASGIEISDFSSNPVTLTIDYTDSLLTAASIDASKTSKLAIYRWDGSVGYYIYQVSVVDDVAKKVTAVITAPGQYIIGIDDTQPTVTDLKVSNSTPTPTITATVKDSFSGLDQTSFVFMLDNVTRVDSSNLLAYLEPVSGLFTYIVTTPLGSGSHTASISVKDSAGNASVINPLTFTVNSTPPTIIHTPVLTTTSAAALQIAATVTDDTTVERIILSYRPERGEFNYTSVDMINNSGNSYVALIPKEMLTALGVRYTIKAIDADGNVAELLSPVIIEVNDSTPPDMPLGLSVTKQGNELLLNWIRSTAVDIAGYRIYSGNTVEAAGSVLDVGLIPSTLLTGLDLTKTWYFKISSIDISGNESQKSSYYSFLWAPYNTLTLTMSGSGGGNVTSDPQGITPAGISCTSGTCTTTFPYGTIVSLLKTPDIYSLFNGWGVDCTGVDICTVAMVGPKAVTSTFNLAPKIKLDANASTGYDSFTDAYTNASGSIHSLQDVLTGDWTLGGSKAIVLKGGYQADYQTRTGYTTIKGKVSVMGGSLRVDKVKVRQ
jgi:PKD repeat protein